jgi:hypothetical protein
VCPRNEGIQRKRIFQEVYIKCSGEECLADKIFDDVNSPAE